MPSPPLNGTLIRRLAGPDDGTGLNDAREWWYNPDPAVRSAAQYFIQNTSDFTDFDLDPTDVIDRWCAAPGIAPYTEIQVTHRAGTGNVDFTPFDGATACQVVCTLGVNFTAGTATGGRADLTATATGAQGAVLFSLDEFNTPGVAPTSTAAYTWPAQRTGTYTVTARETRVGGCVAKATLRLTSAYGLRYECDFKDDADTACSLRIFERDYTGAVEPVRGQPDPVQLDWPGGATDHLFTSLIKGSECQLAFLQQTPDQFRPLFSGDERLHRVEYRRGGALLWKGFLLPEQYDAVFLAPPTNFSLSASDGLGALSTTPFAGPAGQLLRGDWTMLQILQYCLDKLELGLPLNVRFNLYPGTATLGASALEQIKVDVGQYVDEKGQPWTCGKVFAELFKPHQARLFQWAGAWWFERLIELTVAPMPYVVFGPGGTSDLLLDRLHTIEPPTQGPLHWETAGQHQLARGAVSTVTVEADPGEVANLVRFALPKNTDLPAALPSQWTSNTSTPTLPFSALVYAGKNKPPLLRLIGSTAPASAAISAPWVQLPATQPIAFANPAIASTTAGGSLHLAFTAHPYGNTPSTSQPSLLSFAIQVGSRWLTPGGSPPSASPVLLGSIAFPDTKEVDVSLRYLVGNSVTGAQPVTLRFYAPVSGATALTVDISDLVLSYEDISLPAGLDPLLYTSTYTTDTRQLVSRVDKDDTLFHTDTPNARYAGTFLDANGLPVRGWYEPTAPGQLLEVGDWLVTARNLWQRASAQVLTGLLCGPLDGPGALLTDPNESAPGVYVLTSCTHSAAFRTWQISAVQDLLLIAPPEELPDNAIYLEDGTALQSQSTDILVYENA